MKKSIRILTIDLEDWYHLLDHPLTKSPEQWVTFESRVEKNVHWLLELLDKYNIQATWFCLGWVAARYPSLIREVAKRHEIACHTYLHQLVYEQDRQQFIADAKQAKSVLEDITGCSINTFRAAGFSVTPKSPWYFEALSEVGFRIDSSVFPARRQHGGHPSFGIDKPCRIQTNYGELLEFPLPVKLVAGRSLVYSGGGYFRLLPYQLIRRWIGQSDYSLTYFHPRDFDPSQPLAPGLPLKRRFMSYYGLKSSRVKFESLLRDFKFETIGTVAERLHHLHLPLLQIGDDGSVISQLKNA